jgi:subtilase family serine protease
VSYPPYGSGPGGNGQQPNGPYQNGPFPPRQSPGRPGPGYGNPQQPPGQPGPYGPGPAGAPQPPYGQGQPPYGGGRPPYGPGQPPQGGGMPPYGGGRPPYGGGPGIPGGGAGGPGGPRRSKKGLLITLGVVLVVVVGGCTAVMGSMAHHSSASGSTGGTGPTGGTDGGINTTSNGGTSWTPPSWATRKNDIGPADPRTVVQGTVWFAKQHPQDLAGYATQVGTPGSSDYHKYLTPDQFNSTFTNQQDASTVVTQWVQQAGMTVVSQDAQSVVVSTTLDKVESTLKVQIDKFKHDGRVDISPTSQPQYPSNVGDYVSSVTGLTTTSPVSSFSFQVAPTAPKKKGKTVSAGTGRYTAGEGSGINTQWCSLYWGEKRYNDAPDAPWGSALPMRLCGYTPSQLRHAYGVTSSGLTGKGVTIAIVDAFASPTIEQDVAAYNRQMGLPAFTSGQFTQVLPSDGFDPSTDPKAVQSWAGEETMDIEAAHAMAPDAKIVYYGARSDSQSDFDNAMEAIVAKRAADIVSCSWGGPESGMPQQEFQADTQIFEQGAAEGIGFNFASMDNGDYTAAATESSDPSYTSPNAQVAFPASDPFATGVGGTSLGIDAAGDYSWETGWGNWYHQLSGGSWGSAGDFIGGSGGGNSEVFQQPSYQKGIVPDSLTTASGSGNADREVPDVSLVGDWDTGLLVGITEDGTVTVNPNGSGATFSESGGQYTVYESGGTSLATPLLSGVEALAQQAAGGVPVGFANPVLYKLSGTSALHDVAGRPSALGHEPGMETWDQNHDPEMIGMDSDTSLKTASGYDDVTGVGSIAPGFLTWFKEHPQG